MQFRLAAHVGTGEERDIKGSQVLCESVRVWQYIRLSKRFVISEGGPLPDFFGMRISC